MKVCIADVRYPPETFLDRKYRALAAAGVRVEVLSSSVRRSSTIDGVVWRRISSRNGRVWERLLRRFRASGRPYAFETPDLEPDAGSSEISAATEEILRFTADADVVHFEWILSARFHEALFERQHVPVTVSLRGSQVKVAPHDPKRPQVAASLRWVLERAALVHCVSQDILDSAERFGLDRENARIIHPAVDVAAYGVQAPQRAGGELQVVSVGRFEWLKGLEFALVAVARCVAAGVKLRYHLVGDGPEADRLRYVARELGIDGHVSFHGTLSPMQVGDLLRTSDVFLLPSLEEGIANAALEAMASGVPVISTNVGGMPEAVVHGETGMLVPPRRPDEMAVSLQMLAQDATRRAILGRAGRARVEALFDIRQQAEKWAAFYAEAAPAKRRPRARG